MMAVTVDDICARVELERKQAKINALLSALRSIAEHFDTDFIKEPSEIYWPDGEDRFTKDEHWNRAFEQGKRRGEWVIGEVAQTAIDEWEATA